MGHTGMEFHSNRSLNQRREALDGFRNGRYRILVATDIAARGIDVSNIELVINYDLPTIAEDYVHRIGRTGRAGENGHAISFARPDQKTDVYAIERLMRPSCPYPNCRRCRRRARWQLPSANLPRARNPVASAHQTPAQLPATSPVPWRTAQTGQTALSSPRVTVKNKKCDNKNAPIPRGVSKVISASYLPSSPFSSAQPSFSLLAFYFLF